MLNNIGEACTACRACEQICPNSAIILAQLHKSVAI
ncbi:4Fe-4S binding protein [Parabacteroides sp. 20_3]|nr:4Fe-4S binding protein [Parabacteroides sp. 20_3]